MSLNVDRWRSKVKESLPSTHYKTIINPPVGGGREIEIRTESAAMPGISFLSVDNFSPYGNGKMYNIPYRYNPQEVTMVHTMDNKADIYKTYMDWSNEIVDLDPTGKFPAKYLKDYTTDFTLVVYNRQGEIAKQIVFIEAFPIVVEPVSLSWGSHDELAKLSVNYRFTSFIVSP